jgi:hypothetical protein
MRGVRLTRASSATQRALGTAVIALLAANGFAAALVHDDAGLGRRPATASEAAASASGAAVRTVTLITTRDGRRLVADPNTAAGRKAIADARRDGGTVQTVPVPAQKAPSGKVPTVPGATGTDGALDLGTLVGDLLDDDPGEGSGESGRGGGGGLVGVIEIGQATFDRILEDTRTTVTSLADTVGSTPSTVTSILQGVPSTITSVLPTVVAPASSILNQAPTTLPVTPSTSLLSGLGATVTSLLQPVQQQVTTTVPPSPPPTAPVCGLLVHC